MMEELSTGASPDSVRQHRIFYKRPKQVPPFDTAFVRSSDKDSLKLLLSAAPEHCQIIMFTDGPGAAYALRLLFKRKFRLCSQALQLDLRTITFTGQVVMQFVRGGSVREPLARYFCAGESYLHELASTSKLNEADADVIDLFCCGIGFHEVLRRRGRGRSLVFAEEQ